MRPHYSTISRPIPDAIDYASAADQLRADSDADIAYIESLVSVACDYVGDITGRIGVQSTMLCVADSWESLSESCNSNLIKINRSPLSTVSHIKYYPPGSATLATIDSALYRVITTTQPGLIQPVTSWPDVEDRPDAVQITFIAGHTDANPVSSTWKHAVKMLVAHLYEERKPVAFTSCYEIPFTLKNLIEHNRMEGRFG